MFIKKHIPSKKTNTYKLEYTSFLSGMNTDLDENLMSSKKAKIYYNFDVKNGALKTGIGFEDLTLPKYDSPNSDQRTILLPQGVGFNGVWHFKYYSQTDNKKDHFLVYYGDDNKLYWCKLISLFPQSFYVDQEMSGYPTRPNALQYRLNGVDVMLFTGPTSDMCVWEPESEATIVQNAPKIVSMCLHYDRLFAIVEGERIRLRFSDDLDPTNWETSTTEGGYIDLIDERGPMSRVVSFNDYVYVFRDFGISRIYAYGDQSDFSVSGVHTSSGKIYGGSVAVCGSQIIYLSKNGLYTFDGVSCQKLNLNIDSLFDGISNENCCSAYLDNKYYLACKLNFNDGQALGCESCQEGYTNNALIELDLESGNINIVRGVDIVSMTAVEEGFISKLICCFGGQYKNRIGQLNHLGTIFGTTLKKVWSSPKSDMGFANSKKIIKKISILTHSNMCIKISTEDKDYEYSLSAKNTPQTLIPNVGGKLVQISFLSNDSSCDISKPEVIVGVVS